jgi:hypothetical protein
MTEVNEMKAQGKIREDQAQMYASLTEAEIDKRTSIESETVAYYKMAKTKEDEELAVAAVMKAHKHLYPKVLKTAEDYDKLRRAIATSGQAVLTALKLTTGERLPEILSDIEGKALNKISHVNDFRGSHFDIKQAFAEGFDPDRIAVAFSNDLAVLGERQRQANSGIVSPLGVR